MLDVPRQYLSVALMLSYKLDFSCCADMDGFPRPSHIYRNYVYTIDQEIFGDKNLLYYKIKIHKPFVP